MKIKIRKIALIIVGVILLSCPRAIADEINKESNKCNEKQIILIDPGHGGMDGGAVGKDGTLEKDINLQIALKVRDKLKDKNYDIKMTRESDEGLYHEGQRIREKKLEDLSRRCKMKEETKCTIFVSIHQNMFTQPKYKGAQVWYASNERSKILGEIMQETLKNNLDKNNNRKSKPANDMYKILRCNKECASIIVECGFMSNYEELQLLKNDDYQNKVADAIVKGLDQYMEKISSKTN